MDPEKPEVPENKKRKRKIIKIPEKEITSGLIRNPSPLGFSAFEYETEMKIFESGRVLISNKGKVVARAKWKDGALTVVKIRRPSKTNLQEGDILYNFSFDPHPIEKPPEIKTEGWQLVRYKNYDHSQAVRPDPLWETHEGWFILPEKINGKNGIDELLIDYPELQGNLSVLSKNELDESKLKMAEFESVDAYVCGRTDEVPELIDFHEPASKDIVTWQSITCYCGCGDIEGYSRYWTDKWIVYVPRTENSKTIDDSPNTIDKE